jgi:hypothetical protein
MPAPGRDARWSTVVQSGSIAPVFAGLVSCGSIATSSATLASWPSILIGFPAGALHHAGRAAGADRTRRNLW